MVAAFWSATAIALSGEFVEANGLLRTLNSELNGIRLDKLIVLAALIVFYYKVWDRFVEDKKWITHLLSAFFSVCMLIGISYSTQGSWVFFMGNRKQMVIAFLAFVGYFILFDVVLSVFYGWLSRYNLYQVRAKKPIPAFAQKHGLLYDTDYSDKSKRARFRIIDKGQGQVILQCEDGQYVFCSGYGIAGDVRLTTDESKAEVFMWQDYLNHEFMLMSMRTHRYVGKSPTTGSPYSMDYTGSDPARRKGAVFRWE